MKWSSGKTRCPEKNNVTKHKIFIHSTNTLLHENNPYQKSLSASE